MSSSVLRYPTQLSFGLPERDKIIGLNEKSLHLIISDSANIWDNLERVEDTDTLYCLLENIKKYDKWQEYIDVDMTFFQWRFNDHIIYSCNPFFELLMRCSLKLFIIFNKLTAGTNCPGTEDMDNLLCQMNFALDGLQMSDHEEELCSKIYQPALFTPPNMRKEHHNRFKERGLEISEGISVHTLQFIIYLILAERWLSLLEEKIQLLFKQMKAEKVQRDTILEEQTRQLVSLLFMLYTDVLRDPLCLFADQDVYRVYLKQRFDPSNNQSDFSKLELLSRALSSEGKSNIMLDKERLKSTAHVYVDNIYSLVRKLYKLGPCVFNKIKNKTFQRLKLYTGNITSNKEYELATAYRFESLYSPYQNTDMELYRVKHLEKDIPLAINTMLIDNDDDSYECNGSHDKINAKYVSCFKLKCF